MFVDLVSLVMHPPVARCHPLRKQRAILLAAAIAVCGPMLWGLVFAENLPDNVAAVEVAGDFTPATQARRPVDFVITSSWPRMIVINSASGTASVIDTRNETVVAEFEIGENLSAIDVDPVSNTHRLFITDEARNELIVATFDGTQLEVTDRIATPVSPIDVATDGRFVVVACKWSRRVVTFQSTWVGGAQRLIQLQEISLAFEPGRVTALSGDRFLVTDAFGGDLVLLDVEMGRWHALPAINGHNITGVSASPGFGNHLYLTHQFLNPLASTTHDDVQWGSLVENLVRTFNGSQFSEPLTDEATELQGEIERIGEVGRGAGDPAGVALQVLPPDCREGRIIALSGVDEVLIETTGNNLRIPVGDCPTQVLVDVSVDHDHAEREAYVLNMLDDSMTVIDLESYQVKTTIALGPRPPLTPAQRGESLFRDATLSLDGWLSCHSCHTDGHTNGLMADTTSDGSYQTPKAIPSLLGTRDANPWAWNGSFRELHAQVRQSVVSSMQGAALSAVQEQDLVAFLHTLKPPPPLMPPVQGADAEQVARGEQVFRRQGCAACHVPPLTYTSDTVYDVGMIDEAGLNKFNPPTLRGVSHRRRFFHDQRAGSLREVLIEHDHMAQGLSEDEIDDLIRFLMSL